MNYFKRLLKKSKVTQKTLTILGVIIVVAIISTYLLTSSRAATPSASFNADNGQLSGNAVKQACTGSSDNNSVIFDGGSTSRITKMIGINGTVDDGRYDFTANAASMGVQWERIGIW